jgi:VIT1/CCC1 family predicted Fe2+/Mn2+ transporter
MKAIFLQVERRAFPDPQPALVQDLGDFAVAMMVEEAIDLGDEVGLVLADLGDRQRPIEHDGASGSARQPHMSGDRFCLDQRHVVDQQAQNAFALGHVRHVHAERHLIARIGWLRAAVLGANDGIVSTASLIVGVAAAATTKNEILIAGVAGLVAGAMSMAAGEYVSVSSQADTEAADIARETRELRDEPEAELAELIGIYEARGLDTALATEVAKQLMSRDALSTHLCDELGISEVTTARPVQAALTSAATFAAGAALPLLVAALAASVYLIPAVVAATLVALAGLGALGAQAGGARVLPAAGRVTFWGALAMAVTAVIGAAFGTVV